MNIRPVSGVGNLVTVVASFWRTLVTYISITPVTVYNIFRCMRFLDMTPPLRNCVMKSCNVSLDVPYSIIHASHGKSSTHMQSVHSPIWPGGQRLQVFNNGIQVGPRLRKQFPHENYSYPSMGMPKPHTEDTPVVSNHLVDTGFAHPADACGSKMGDYLGHSPRMPGMQGVCILLLLDIHDYLSDRVVELTGRACSVKVF